MDFSSMNGWDFERYCADCLLKKGFTKAEVTSGSGDHGVDIIAEQNGIRFGIQCKLYQGQIPNKAVQEAYTGASYYDCDVAVIMSNSELTKQAQAEAKKLRVKFWNVADYLPQNTEETVLNDEINQSNYFLPDYESYKRSQRAFENHLEDEMQTRLKSADGNEGKNLLLPELKKSSHKYRYTDATEWLDLLNSNKETWYPLIRSMQYFCCEFRGESASTLAPADLLDKLHYMDQLAEAFSAEGKYLLNSLRKNCERISNGLCANDSSFSSADAKTLNLIYWKVLYSINQSNHVFKNIQKILETISDDEYSIIKDTQALTNLLNLNRSMIDSQKTLSVQVQTYQRVYSVILQYRNAISENLNFCTNAFSFLQENQDIKAIIEEQSVILEEPNAKTRYEEKQRVAEAEQEAKKRKEEREKAYYMFLEAQERARPQFEMELRKKKEEQDRILRKKQEADKRELEEKLKERQREEQERLVRAEQMRKKLLQVILAFISRVAEDKEAEAKLAEKRKRLEEEAGEQIQQAQNQIDEFFRQKNTFSLFRKKRDAELDAKIAVLSRHIEQIKQTLSSEIEKSQQDENCRRIIKGLK